jgi:hypothetical protein
VIDRNTTRRNTRYNSFQPGVSYAQITANRPQVKQPHSSQQLTENQQIPAHTTPQSNELVELKNIIKNLVEKMDTMLNILTTLVAKMA